MTKKIVSVLTIITVILSFLLTNIYAEQGEIKKRYIVKVKNLNEKLDNELLSLGIGKVKAIQNSKLLVLEMTTQQKEMFKSNFEVDCIEEDLKAQILAKSTRVVEQPSQYLPWGIDQIDGEKVTNYASGKAIKVAVLDTGIELTHPDLKQNIAGGINTVNPRKSYNDDNGHGTHVSGIIAGAYNSIGIYGVAPSASLYAVKVLDSQGSGYVSDIIEGIEWCISNNIQIINMSLGMSTDVSAFHDAIYKAYNNGIIVVAAAGNDPTKPVCYPAMYQESLSIGATDKDNNLAWFSSFGKVDFVAPGVNIPSTYIYGTYKELSGTSMATPHVSGALAVIFSSPDLGDENLDGYINSKDVISRLRKGTIDLGTSGKDNFFGEGIINLYNSFSN